MSGAFGLLGKYASALREAWRGRKEMAPAALQPHELEFLPAHLEVRDKPVSPAPLWVARLIVVFALLALAWSVWGEVEIVVAAGGKVVPGGRTKVVQPLEPGVIKRIAVKDGDRVRQGDLLVELDATSVGPCCRVCRTVAICASRLLADIHVAVPCLPPRCRPATTTCGYHMRRPSFVRPTAAP
jgi:hemolysin D